MRVFENKHLSIDYFSEISYFKVIRISSELIDDEDYKKLMLQWREQIEYYKPKVQLVSYLNYYMPISPSMQTWINDNLVAPSFKAGMEKVGFIISRDLYVQISVEQTMQEEAGKKFSIKYFDNETDAEKWLLNPFE